MSGGYVAGDQSAIESLAESLRETAADYEANRAKLDGLVQQITGGQFKGDLADAFVRQYNAKKDIFESVQRSIDNAEANVDDNLQGFVKIMNSAADTISGN